MVDYKEIKLIKDGEECVPFAPNKADKTDIDNLVTTKASKMELETSVEELESKINEKQDKLTAGDNVVINNNVISSISVPIGTLITSVVDLGDKYKICDGSRIEDYHNELNTNKIKPVLYRLYNKNTQNFHQQIFTTDKDICKKVNPDTSKLFRPIRNGCDCYGINTKGFVRINQNEEISMKNGTITSASGFYDGEFEIYDNSLQILTIFAENYKRAYIEYIPFYNTFRLLDNSVSKYNKIASHENIIVIIDGNNVEYSLDDETFTSINGIDKTSVYSVYCFNGLFVITTQNAFYFTHDVTGEWSKIDNHNKISNIAYDGNYFVGVSGDNFVYYTPNLQDPDMWEKCTIFDNNVVKGKFDNVVVFKKHFIVTFDNGNYKDCLYSIPCSEINNSNYLWNKHDFNHNCNIGKLKVVNDILFALDYKKYINRYEKDGALSLNTIFTTFYASDFLNFKELPGDFTCYDVACSNETFLFCTSADMLVKNITGIPITTPLSTPESKAQELTDYTEHNYIQHLEGQYEIDCVSKHNDENVRIYSAADTDVTISDNGWLTNAVDGKYLNIGTYNYSTAKWEQNSLVYSGNINSTAGSTDNKICLEFDFITPPTFVATRDIFYAYRTLIFRVADVNGKLNMYMAGYKSNNALKWKYSNVSTGITLDSNTKYHLKFETTGFSTTSPYYTYTLSITPYNILDTLLLEERTQIHTFNLAYLPYNYYSNSSANSMSTIYCADASAWVAGQMLDLRSFKLTWNNNTTYALNNTTKYSNFYEPGIYAPYLENSYIRTK